MTPLAATLERFNARRRFPDWKPEDPYSPYHENSPVATAVIKRMLALLDLEVTVGEWVRQALASADLQEAQPFVERNSSDESRHDLALRKLVHYVGGSSEDPASRSLVNRWQAQKPSFSLAYALEMGVFFSLLPALTKLGDMYCVKVSQWISDDEGVHVLVNGHLAKLLGEKVTKEQASLVVDTLAWVFQPLGAEEVQEVQKRALRRLATGKDETMMDSSVPVTPAFFEQKDKRSIVY
jgi:hypothetical protein